jgi:PTS system cellobiose-specific IIB component
MHTPIFNPQWYNDLVHKETRMKKIRLFCAGGLTTTLLVNKMKAAATAMGYDVDISAHPVIELNEKGAHCDLIILGPQIASSLKEVEAKFPHQKVMVCDMVAFGNIDAKKILEKAKMTLGD